MKLSEPWDKFVIGRSKRLVSCCNSHSYLLKRIRIKEFLSALYVAASLMDARNYTSTRMLPAIFAALLQILTFCFSGVGTVRGGEETWLHSIELFQFALSHQCTLYKNKYTTSSCTSVNCMYIHLYASIYVICCLFIHAMCKTKSFMFIYCESQGANSGA